MKMRYGLFCLVLAITLTLTSCVSAKNKLNAKFDTLPQIGSTLLYDYSAVFSGATAECRGTLLHRWYGAAIDAEAVTKLYSDSLAKNGWSIWPEEVIKIWSIEGQDGLFRVGVDTFTAADNISKEQGSYQLPDSVLLEATNYQTIYLINMVYMSPSEAKSCFGR
jgi:hypothetical protein